MTNTTYSSSIQNMTTEGNAGLPAYFIPTVSAVGIFVLIMFLSVVIACLRKRCMKPSNDRKSTPLDNPVSVNTECWEIEMSVNARKRTSDEIVSGVTDQSGGPTYDIIAPDPREKTSNQSYETVDLDPAGGRTATHVKSRTTNKVHLDGTTYALVDIEKKAQDRKEKEANATEKRYGIDRPEDRAYATLEADCVDGTCVEKSATPLEVGYTQSTPMKSTLMSSLVKGDKVKEQSSRYESIEVTSKGVSGSTKDPSSLKPDLYPLNAYETVSQPLSPKLGPSESNQTSTGSPVSSKMIGQEQMPVKRESNMSHTYEDPVAMVHANDEHYDSLQRGPDLSKQTTSSRTSSKGKPKAKGTSNHDDIVNVYNELASPGVAQRESESDSDAYQHLQCAHSERRLAREPLLRIPDEGYGRLDLDASCASNNTTDGNHQGQDGSKTPSDPVYANLA
ncbi:uncharacterized protein LOC135157306 [Lytechinus pictus]|uniref:uncharacterized protein LOC135157306 n=1 Tax=Lytechinus pictus TaxID=7653 RepID=UPI0030B9F2EB